MSTTKFLDLFLQLADAIERFDINPGDVRLTVTRNRNGFVKLLNAVASECNGDYTWINDNDRTLCSIQVCYEEESARAKKNKIETFPGAGMRPEVMLHWLLDNLEDVESVVAIRITHDGKVGITYSNMSTARMCTAAVALQDTAARALTNNGE